MAERPFLLVAAAVVERDGCYLMTRRLAGTHLQGAWEFPGGKCEPQETLSECLARELLEEIGCHAAVGAELLTVLHDYPDRTVELHFFRCEIHDEPQRLLGQEIRWVRPAEFQSLSLPPADEALIRQLGG